MAVNKRDFSKGINILKAFESLNERTKEVVFHMCQWKPHTFSYLSDFLTYEERKFDSPVEELFAVVFYIIEHDMDCGYWLDSQSIIDANNHKYRADFEVLEYGGETKILIEIDGHNFHEKTKEQVAKDKDREYDLKFEGYDVIRYSGSQVYNDPIEYVLKTIMYLDRRLHYEED